MSSTARKTCSITLILLGLLLFSIFIKLTDLGISNYSFKDKIGEKYKFKIDLSVPLTPSGIRITAVNDSSNSMEISWYTTADATEPKVVYSDDPSLTDNITVLATSKFIDDGYNTYIYTANLKNLELNTTYYYQVSSDSSNTRDISEFRTIPGRNATSSRFLLFGDSRSQPEQRNELAKKIMENFDDIEFTIHTGDIVEDGRNQTQWNEYFNDVEILTKNIPGYYIEGNHEQQSQYMYDNIPLPSNGLDSRYYHFSVGAISFIGLNTERDISEQTTWLENTLKFIHQDNNTLWKIVYMHQPFFNSRSTRPDRTDLIEAWGPLFEEYNVDFLFAGHNHYYERSYPMNLLKEYDDSNLYYFENPLNPIYFITGGAGAPLYIRDTDPVYAPFYNSTYHFIIAEVSVDDVNEETILKFETWGMPNDYTRIYLIDNLTVVKKGAFIDIHKPEVNQLFGKNAPHFNISINKVRLKPAWFKLNKSWYSIDNGKTNYTFTGTNGKINQSAWDSIINDTIIINFYANDSLGNIVYNTIKVHKDFIPPNISILGPIPNQLFGLSSLNFSLIIDEPFLNLTWYTIDEGKTNYTFTGLTGTVNQTAWDSLEDGIISITFYANDSLGNLGINEILVHKDTIAPNITLIYPHSGKIFGIAVPNYTIIIKDEHLHSMWYTFNESGKKIMFTENSTINQEEWENLSNGAFKLIFYANDSAGNIDYVEIIIYKNISEDGYNRDLAILIGTVISFIIFLTIGLISYIYLLLKKIKFKDI
jgi:hypothetical protein